MTQHFEEPASAGMLNRFFGRELDATVFYLISALTVPFILMGVFWPELLAQLSGQAVSLVFETFQSVYMLGVTAVLLFCIIIALSPLGRIRLGQPGERTEFSTFSWFSMLFSAGMGIGLIFWSVSEPLVHMAAPPIGEPNTFAAARLGLEMYFFHWGFHAWAIYAVVGLMMAYFQFRKGEPALLSRCLVPVIGERYANGLPGRIVDTFAAWATIFGLVTGLGMGGMQMASGISSLMDIPGDSDTTTTIILLVTLAFIVSAITGVARGIRWLSNLNVLLMLALMLFFLGYGPTDYILETFRMGLGDYLRDLPELSFSTTLFGNDGWTQGWTVFFWAFWIAWAPFVGAFIARVSRGRSVREFVLGVVCLPPLFSFLFSAALGGTTMQLQFVQGIDVSTVINNDLSVALFETLSHLPLFNLMTGLSLLLIFSFLITSCDSATYVATSFATGGRKVSDRRAARRLVIVFGTVLGLLTVAFNYSGSLKGLQSATIVGSVPFFLIILLGMLALTRALINDHLQSQTGTAQTADH